MPQIIIVIAASITSMIIGFLWYSPFLFGNLWMRLSGFTKESMDQMKAKGMGKTYGISFILEIVTAYVFSHLILATNTYTIPGVLELSSFVWLGFFVPVLASGFLWDKKPFMLFVLHSLHRLATLLAIGCTLVLLF